MKYLILTLLLVSTSVLAQGYGYLPQQQYDQGYYPQQQYDQGYYNNYEQQRQLQDEFLDRQFMNQLHIQAQQEMFIKQQQRENCKRLNPLSLNC